MTTDLGTPQNNVHAYEKKKNNKIKMINSRVQI